MGDEAQQSIWNFDGAELNLIFQIKVEASLYLTNWNLESCYWRLRDLRREIDAKLNEDKKKVEYEIEDPDNKGKKKKLKISEKESVDYLLKELEGIRNEFLTSDQQQNDFSKYYLALEEFYLYLARLMKQHGLYFREGEDAWDSFRRR